MALVKGKKASSSGSSKSFSAKSPPLTDSSGDSELYLGDGVHPAYAYVISLYRYPPTEEVTLEEFENFANDRIIVLREIDAAQKQGWTKPGVQERLKETIEKYLPLRLHGTNRLERVRKDVISHFALRLAYARNGDKDWWVRMEEALLRYRISNMHDKLAEILSCNGIKYPNLSYVSLQNDAHSKPDWFTFQSNILIHHCFCIQFTLSSFCNFFIIFCIATLHYFLIYIFFFSSKIDDNSRLSQSILPS
jgi:hypothetical protein